MADIAKVPPDGNISNVLKHVLPLDTINISHNLYLFIMFINLGVICQSIAVFGVVTNVFNTIIFLKQGFSDTINISLFALTLSDLFSLLSIMFSNILYTRGFQEKVPYFDIEDVSLITGGWIHVIFTRTTAWITAFISFERCVCVIRPLLVKTIFTPRTHIVTMVAIFSVTFGCSSLIYVMVGFDWKFFPERNKTLVGLVNHLTTYGKRVSVAVCCAVNGVFMPMLSFLTAVVCTAVLVIKLNQNSAWRSSNISVKESSLKETGRQRKNQRVAKMVVFLSVMFISSFIPAVIIFIAATVEPQLNYFGRYKHIFVLAISTSFISEVINSSSNYFIYYTMSSKYRNTLHGLFG